MQHLHPYKSLVSISNHKISIIDPITNVIIPLEDYIDHTELNNRNIIWTGFRNETIYIITEELQVYKYHNQLSKHHTLASLDGFLGIDAIGSIIQYDNDVVSIYNPTDKTTYKLSQVEVNNCDAITISGDGHLFLSYYRNGKTLFKKNVDGILANRIEIDQADIIVSRPIDVEIKKDIDNHIVISKNIYINQVKSNIVGGTKNLTFPTNDFLISKSNILYDATDLGVYVIKDDKQIFNHLAIDEDMLNSVRSLLMSKDLQCYRTSEKEIISSPSHKYDS